MGKLVLGLIYHKTLIEKKMSQKQHKNNKWRLLGVTDKRVNSVYKESTIDIRGFLEKEIAK